MCNRYILPTKKHQHPACCFSLCTTIVVYTKYLLLASGGVVGWLGGVGYAGGAYHVHPPSCGIVIQQWYSRAVISADCCCNVRTFWRSLRAAPLPMNTGNTAFSPPTSTSLASTTQGDTTQHQGQDTGTSINRSDRHRGQRQRQRGRRRRKQRQAKSTSTNQTITKKGRSSRKGVNNRRKKRWGSSWWAANTGQNTCRRG